MSDELALLAAIVASPEDTLVLGVYADWLDDHERHAEAVGWRAAVPSVDPLTARAIADLTFCRFTPGSWDKRFARDMGERVSFGPTSITAKQYAWVWKLAWKYRRQLGPSEITRRAECLAQRPAAGAT